MTGRYVFEVDPKICTYVTGKTGPLLRFTATHGFIENPLEDGQPGRKYLQTIEGCIGQVDWETGQFTWSPPLHRFGWRWKQLTLPTREIIDGIIGALNRIGVIQPYIKKHETWRSIQVAEVETKKVEQAVYTLNSAGSFVDE